MTCKGINREENLIGNLSLSDNNSLILPYDLDLMVEIFV